MHHPLRETEAERGGDPEFSEHQRLGKPLGARYDKYAKGWYLYLDEFFAE
jgi:hypothetical protein